MPLISVALQEKMPRVPQDETMYLVMDNTGGAWDRRSNWSVIAITGSQCTRPWALDVNPELGREAALPQDNNC
jgi:hypothetical protein